MEEDKDPDDSESDGDEPNLDWLPDPDKIYGPEGGQKESVDEASGHSDDDSESNRYGLYRNIYFPSLGNRVLIFEVK